MREQFAESFAQQRFMMALLAGFAGVALILAGVGVYGVMSYTVVQRTREMGIRIALGAARRQVRALVVRQGMTVAMVGVVIGFAGAIVCGRFIASQLYGVEALDALSLGAAVLIFTAVALVACYVPARRATRVNPVIALRAE